MGSIRRNSIKKTAAALSIGLSLTSLAPPTHAVHINPNGTGQALVFPYYTVRGMQGGTARYDTYISITNTKQSSKAVKIRLLEGKLGASVLAFNLYLGGGDIWTGAVVATPNGARLVSADKSCVVPVDLFSNTGPTTDQNTPNVFKSVLLGTPADASALDNTREGHLEAIEMGVVTEQALASAIDPRAARDVLNCGLIATREADLANPFSAALSPPTGGLFGGASLLNSLAGIDYSYDAIALDNWYSPRAGNIWTNASSSTPSIVDGGALVSDIFTDNGDKISSTWANGVDAVSALMMRTAILNDFVLDEVTASGTDWVVTFPTKRYHTGEGTDGKLGSPLFVDSNFTPKGCQSMNLQTQNRAQSSICDNNGTTQCIVGVPPPPLYVPRLCYQTNVMTYYKSQNLGSTNALAFGYNGDGRDRYSQKFQNGWTAMGFNKNFGGLVPVSTTVNDVASEPLNHFGLPVAGFMVRSFLNRTIAATTGANAAASYGGQFVHKYQTNIAKPLR